MSGRARKEKATYTEDKRDEFFRIATFSGAAGLILTAPFFLYPLFERPSLSQRHYVAAAGLSAVFFWLLFYLSRGRARIKSPPHPVYFAWVFFGIIALSSLLCETPGFSIREALFFFACGGLFSILALTPFSNRDRRKLLGVFYFLGILGSLYGVMQNYGLDVLPYSDEFKVGKLHVVSFFGHPNYLAAFLAPLFILFTGRLFHGSVKKRALFALAAGLCLVCLLLAGTRGAWVSLAAAVPVLFYLHMRRKPGVKAPAGRTLLVFIAALLIMAFLIGVFLPLLGPRYDLRERLADSMPLLSRLYSWRMAGEMLRDHPVLGAGFGRYKTLYWDYSIEFQSRPGNEVFDYLQNYGEGVPPLNVHNEFLEIAAETGLLGFIAFIAFLAAIFRYGWMTLNSPGASPGSKRTVAALLAALVCVLTDAVFNFPLHQPISALLFWSLCAMVLFGEDERKNQASGPSV